MKGGRGGKGMGGGGGGAGGGGAQQAMMSAQMLLYSPGMQQLLMYGGRGAQDTVTTMAGLGVNQPRMQEVAEVWRDAADRVGSVADTLAGAVKKTDEWGGEAAEQFRARYREQAERHSELAARYRRVGDTLAQTADAMGEAHGALMAVTAAAGKSMAALGSDLSAEASSGAATVIVNSWQAVSEQLVAHYGTLAASAATALAEA